MIVCVFERVQWRWALDGNGRLAPGLRQPRVMTCAARSCSISRSDCAVDAGLLIRHTAHRIKSHSSVQKESRVNGAGPAAARGRGAAVIGEKRAAAPTAALAPTPVRPAPVQTPAPAPAPARGRGKGPSIAARDRLLGCCLHTSSPVHL
jgi:hypothetical protein